MKLSVVIPAHNEAESLKETTSSIYNALIGQKIEHELLVINDNSQDNTLEVLEGLKAIVPTLRFIKNDGPCGFGRAVVIGFKNFTGDCVAVFMADLSDSPEDLVKFYNKMREGNYDCVFGSRFIKGAKLICYPPIKLIINRIANFLVSVMFGMKYNDCTNAFKLYKRETVDGLRPFLSPHFNLTLELPLKAIVRGYSYAVLPNSWTNRKYGKASFKIREMGSRYLFVLFYCLIEKFFSKGDFKKKWN